MLSLMTFTAGTAFRNATTTGAESAMLQYFQQFVTTQAGFMTKEAVDSAYSELRRRKYEEEKSKFRQ